MLFRKKGADNTTIVRQQMMYQFYCDFRYLNLPTQHFRYAIPYFIIHTSNYTSVPLPTSVPPVTVSFLARINLTNHLRTHCRNPTNI